MWLCACLRTFVHVRIICIYIYKKKKNSKEKEEKELSWNPYRLLSSFQAKFNSEDLILLWTRDTLRCLGRKKRTWVTRLSNFRTKTDIGMTCDYGNRCTECGCECDRGSLCTPIKFTKFFHRGRRMWVLCYTLIVVFMLGVWFSVLPFLFSSSFFFFVFSSKNVVLTLALPERFYLVRIFFIASSIEKEHRLWPFSWLSWSVKEEVSYP